MFFIYFIANVGVSTYNIYLRKKKPNTKNSSGTHISVLAITIVAILNQLEKAIFIEFGCVCIGWTRATIC